jgi:hypothetical protein
MLDKIQTHTDGFKQMFAENEITQEEFDDAIAKEVALKEQITHLEERSAALLSSIGPEPVEVADAQQLLENSLAQLSGNIIDKTTLAVEVGVLKMKMNSYTTLPQHANYNKDVLDAAKQKLAYHISTRPLYNVQMSEDQMTELDVAYRRWCYNQTFGGVIDAEHRKSVAIARLDVLHAMRVLRPHNNSDETLEGELSVDELLTSYMKTDAKLLEHMKKKPNNITYDYNSVITSFEELYPNEWIQTPKCTINDLACQEEALCQLSERLDALMGAKFVPKPTMEKPNGIEGPTEASEECTLDDLARFNEGVVLCARDMDKYPSWQKKWSEWQTFVHSMSDLTVAELTKRREDVIAYITIVDAKLKELSEKDELLSRTKREIRELETLEFNPNCNACCKQPKYVRLTELKATIDPLKKSVAKLKRYQKLHDLTKYKIEIDDLVDVIKMRQTYEDRVAFMNEERAIWDRAILDHERELARQIRLAHVWWHLRDVWETEHQSLKSARESLDALVKKLRAFNDTFQSYQRALSDRTIVAEYNDWNKEYMILSSRLHTIQQSLWSTWNGEVTMQQRTVDAASRYLSETKQWTHDLEVMEAAKEWIKWDTTRSDLQAIVDAQEYADLMQQMNRYNLHATVHKCECALAQTEYSCIVRELASLRSRYEAYIAANAGLRLGFKRQQEFSNVYRDIKTVHSDVHSRYTTLVNFQTRFVGDKKHDGFKNWVYKTVVMPLIEKEINEFIKHIEPFRLRLHMRNGNFVYLLEDRGSMPTLDYASGYQKFIVGLGMRLALARIGAVGQNIKHMFIDEGFVACDTNNIQKTKDVLELIMTQGGHHSVLLISHLDTIKDITDVRVDVTRNLSANTSYIRYGKKMQLLPKVVKPRTGIKR